MSVRFELRLGNVVHRPAPPELMEAFQQAQITEAAGQHSGFQLSFWAGKRSKVTERMVARLFDPPTRVIMSVVLRGRRHVLFDGAVTRHDFAPTNEAGDSTLNLTGRDLTFYMDLADVTGRCFPAAAPFVQMQLLMLPYRVFGVQPLLIPNVLQLVMNPLDKIPTQQGTDYAYASQLATDTGFTFYIEPGPSPGVSIGYWGPEVRVGVPQPALTVGSDEGTNVESLNFSFDGLARKVVISDYFNDETRQRYPVPQPDISLLRPPLGPEPVLPLKYVRETLDIPDPPASAGPAALERHEKDVKKMVKKHNASLTEKLLHRLAYANGTDDAITASGQLDVLRYGHVLRPRRIVGVRGASRRYDGHYYVKSVQHTVQPGEYTQSFQLARGQFRSMTSTVGV